MAGGMEKKGAENALDEGKKADAGQENSELGELKHNLRVSFSRMKDDIHSNKQQIDGMSSHIEDLVKANRMLLEQVSSLKDEIKALKERPKGLKTELMRSLARNQKSIIKQRILEMVGQGRFSIPELKERIVDDRNYCSKASFYRYIEELKSAGKIDFMAVEDKEIVVMGSGQAGAEVKKESYV